MNSRIALVLCTLLASLSPSRCEKVSVDTGLVIKDVQRKIDLTSSLVKISSAITLENTGKAGAASFLYAVEEEFAQSVASVSAVIQSKGDDTILKVKSVTADGVNGAVFQITLAKPLAAGKTVGVSVTTAYSHVLQPFPAEIKQAEKQLVRFRGNIYFYSPYKTTSQKTVVSSLHHLSSHTPKPNQAANQIRQSHTDLMRTRMP